MDTNTGDKLAEPHEGTFNVNEAAKETSASGSKERDSLNNSLCIHPCFVALSQKANISSLNQTLDFESVHLLTSTPMTSTKPFNFTVEGEESNVAAAQRKLYGEGPNKLTPQAAADIPSNIVSDRKTFLRQPHNLPNMKPPSRMFKPGSIPTLSRPMKANTAHVLQQTRVLSSTYNLRSTAAAALGVKPSVSSLRKPSASSVTSSLQRAGHGLKPPQAKVAHSALSGADKPAGGPHPVAKTSSSPRKHPLPKTDVMPAAKKKKMDLSSNTSAASSSDSKANNLKPPTQNQRTLPAKPPKHYAASTATAICEPSSRVQTLKAPAGSLRAPSTKPHKGCSNCALHKEQLRLITEENKLLKEELLKWREKDHPKYTSISEAFKLQNWIYTPHKSSTNSPGQIPLRLRLVTSCRDIAPKAQGTNLRQNLMLSDDEEDTKRIVRSAKDKRFEELTNLIKTIRNAMKIRDMSKCLEEFEQLCRAFTKSKNIVDKEGVPSFYIRLLADLEDYLNQLWEDKEGKKKMNKNNAKALSTLRQKIRKYNRDYETEIASYKENPQESADEEEEKEAADTGDSSGSESDDANAKIPAPSFLKKKPEGPDPSKFLKGAKGSDDESSSSDDDDDGEDWSSDSVGSGSESSDDGEGKSSSLAVVFLKKTQESEKGSEKKTGKKKKIKKRGKEIIEEEPEEGEGEEVEGGWEKVKGGVPLIKEKPKMFAKGTEINTVVVVKKLNEILQARGKKGTDRAAQIELFHALAAISAENNLGQGILVKIKFNIIASLYDYNPNLAAFMKPDMWKKCLECIDELLDILFENNNIFIGENIIEDSENLAISDQPFRVRGCILTLVERMDEEFTKIMQNTDPHSQEYVDNLKDESRVCGIIDRLLSYLENKGSTEEICRVYLRRIMHTYYKFDYKAHRRSLGLQGETKSEQDQEESEGEDSAFIMDRLCKFIYSKDRTDRIRTCAILCHIYHHALHSRWYQARDLMLMSHLQDNIQHADPPVQILYNRTMVQLGICAFRQGMIKDAHNALLDIQSSGRAKELLGQGLLMRNMQERNAEQEKIEKRRQVPFHMHINLELLECVYLVSAMLLEIPYMAAHEFDARRRMISKQFHHQLRVGERQPLLGPPESMREHVVAASKAMKMGDWRTCHSFIINEKMNSKVWDLFPETQRVREMLVRKIQEESLRTYLFTYSSVYDSISMETLSDMFQLEIATVHSIISKMIINEELMASLDQPTQTVVMHRTEPTSLQNMALQLAEKLGSLVENNERVFDLKQGVYGGYFNRDQKGGYQQKQGYQRDNKGYQQKQGGYQRGGYRNQNQNQSNY
uniref:Eukaryotic translation initiation factor 3 subunit C n=1 Tax=Knipowitschia caucasica TaxID=637954 RepID=A0AAV2LGP3_KNICA